MLASVLSATLHGIDGRVIRVEVDVAPGLPGFSVVGLADASLQEARERVRGAIRNSGLVFPPRRITVNLAPASSGLGVSFRRMTNAALHARLSRDRSGEETATARQRGLPRLCGSQGRGRSLGKYTPTPT